ncbi:MULTISPECIES: esterase-like activity of phytase family protein [unclassified Aeromicrobium]|uniref:esterase-like activity of phytase family protein n=1 Tax=unclassified Aeromicrobium TaxID=2633570 RepID=UPI00396B1F5A
MSRSLACLAGTAVLATALPLLTTAAADAAPEKSFHRVATYPVFQNVPAGTPASAETVAEISAVSDDGRTLVYTDALGKRIGFLDISDPSSPRGEGSLSLEELGDADDQPTSVSIVGKYVLVVVDTSASFTEPSGRLDVVRLSDGVRVRSIDLGGQPDSIALDPAKSVAAIAIENQRDEEATPAGRAKGDLPQAPAGFVQLLDLEGAPADWSLRRVDLDPAVLGAAGIVEPTDPEPEYVSINGKGTLAVTLQENNGIVLIDTATGEVEKAFSAGSVALSGVDAKKDGAISLTDSLAAAPREPDAVAWIGDDHLATANEGDWKGGTRGWTVFDTDGDVVWDAGNTFERIAVRHGLHNDDRAAKKGAEPEGLAIAEFDGTPYAFVGSERSNFVAVYDVSDPADPEFVQIMPTTNGPEGLLPIPSRGLFAVSSETDDASVGVRATVGLYSWKPGRAAFPSIVSDDKSGAPIGWQALGALSGDPKDATTLWTAADTVIKNGSLYRVDVSATPARITDSVAVTDGGAPAALDIEGLFKRPQGGFWLASEGATGPANVLVRTDDAGAVQERVALPADVTARLGKWGLEGVTATNDADGEHVWFALQRPLAGEDVVRIGRYDVADGTFHWLGYELESPLRGSGDWVGLSEITAIDDDTFAVIERDKLNGPAARNKRIYTFSVPKDSTDELPVVEKRLAIDVLPQLRATNGWTQEKLEGFTIAADGSLYAVTDNDGLKDATGETVFLRLGRATDAFGAELATTTSLKVSASRAAYGARLAATVTLGGAATSGSVELRDGSKVVARARVTGGRATVTLPRLAVGTHRLTARFAGSTSAAASTSTPVTVTVVKAASRTSLAAKGSVRRGKPVKVVATVRAAGHVPTGRVRFVSGGRVLKTVSLRNGKAVATVRLRTTGGQRIRAVYVGSTQTKASTSAPRKVTVRP